MAVHKQSPGRFSCAVQPQPHSAATLDQSNMSNRSTELRPRSVPLAQRSLAVWHVIPGSGLAQLCYCSSFLRPLVRQRTCLNSVTAALRPRRQGSGTGLTRRHARRFRTGPRYQKQVAARCGARGSWGLGAGRAVSAMRDGKQCRRHWILGSWERLCHIWNLANLTPDAR